METTPSTLSIFDRIGAWFRESVFVKLFTIGFLTLILLIPQSWIESLVRERQYRASSVVNEITSKWSGPQTLAGPVLIIPFTNRERIDKGKNGVEIREWKQEAYFLPEQLDVNGNVSPQVLHRGLFDAAVYESAIDLKATFVKPNFKKLGVAAQDIHWGEAQLAYCLSDLRGISDNPVFMNGKAVLNGEPSNQIGFSTPSASVSSFLDDDRDVEIYTTAVSAESAGPSGTGIVTTLPWQTEADFNGTVTAKLNLKGSSLLYFVPVGKTTDINLKGPWANPSFDGEFLPEKREITDKGFSAHWKVLHYNRPFAQEWTGTNTVLSGASFGTRLLIPVDQYQKSIRTAKYGILIILLTFVSLFLVEIIRNIRIHAFQYLLIGAALIIYYTLLLSLSEHVGYNVAYFIASGATVLLVSLYAASFLRKAGMIAFFGAILIFFYGFIFVIIQLQDYSLLLGSIGLFIVIALVMYFSRHITWYKEEALAQDTPMGS
ncbi:cell envelope integrity protein CreD [Fulvivirgaceae bacterium PWU5]|uniref:Cell envelope integrity protein CreD n=1 Tax=Dawidia cretensis TaxID=2782350 RepID=A0AAP2GUF2_9BACT|nr:cell envelope integrity protein CreD [Dawidia cretensis]MBT1708825.1 cell envelope integrity protein CreD [Dawidia cretensis]